MAAHASSDGADEIDRLLAEADGMADLDDGAPGLAGEGAGDGRFPEVNRDYQLLKQAMVNEMVSPWGRRALWAGSGTRMGILNSFRRWSPTSAPKARLTPPHIHTLSSACRAQAAPDLLPFKGDLVWNTRSLLKEQEEGLAAQATQSVELAAVSTIYLLEADRVRYVLSNYLRTRLHKVSALLACGEGQPARIGDGTETPRTPQRVASRAWPLLSARRFGVRRTRL